MELISKLYKKNLVRAFLNLIFVKDTPCKDCAKDKQTKNSFKSKNENVTFRDDEEQSVDRSNELHIENHLQ